MTIEMRAIGLELRFHGRDAVYAAGFMGVAVALVSGGREVLRPSQCFLAGTDALDGNVQETVNLRNYNPTMPFTYFARGFHAQILLQCGGVR